VAYHDVAVGTLGTTQANGVGAAVLPAGDRGRGLLMTVLGEFVLPSGGAVWTQTLLEALAGLGVRDKAARQAIGRLHEQGRLDRVRVGRQTRWTLSPATCELLESGAERIYGFGRTPRRWDGRWVLLMASIPERDRRIRYRMNQGLGWAGFGSLGGGMWLSPWPDREAAAVTLLRGLDVAATSFVARLGRLGEPAELAAQAWDLPGLRGQYEAFLEATAVLAGPADHGRDPDRGGDPDLAAAIALAELVHRWRQFPFADPGLPPALLPLDWPGAEAAQRFAALRSTLLVPARRWWRRTEARLTPES